MPLKLLRNLELDAILLPSLLVRIDEITLLDDFLSFWLENVTEVSLVVVLLGLPLYLIFFDNAILVLLKIGECLLRLFLFGFKQVKHKSAIELSKFFRALTYINSHTNLKRVGDVDRVADLYGKFH